MLGRDCDGLCNFSNFVKNSIGFYRKFDITTYFLKVDKTRMF